MILTTVCSKLGNYVVYLNVMVYSLRFSGLDKRTAPLYIFNDLIEPEDKKKLRKMWNVKFINVNTDIYKEKGKEQPKFWSLESFNPIHYKRPEDVLFLDCDLITIRDITGIDKFFAPGLSLMRERGRACYNAGVVCINSKHISGKQYKQLLDHPMDWAEFGHDQQIINKVFDHQISELPKYYNMMVGHQDEFANMDEAGIVHYIHKPDRTMSQELVGKQYIDIWNRYNEEMNNV